MSLSSCFGILNIHNHTVFSDGHSTVHDYVSFAKKNGIKAFGISDHALHSLLPGSCISEPEVLNEYLDELKRCAASATDAKKMRVFRGLEVQLGNARNLSLKLGEGVFHLDYMLVESYGIWNPDAVGLLDGIKDELGLRALSLAHPIFSGNGDELVRELKRCGLCVELNSGHRTFEIPGQGAYFKKIIRDGVPMTFGSDSHSFERLNDLASSGKFYSRFCKEAGVGVDAEGGAAVARSKTS